MSTAAADPGGFVVITEVSPQPTQVETSQKGQSVFPADSNNKHLQRFYQGKPMELGVTQILGGIFQIFLGIVCDVGDASTSYHRFQLFMTAVPYWSGLLYIISGSLSVAAANKPTIGQVRGSLVMNIISSLASGIAIIFYDIHIVVKNDTWHYASYFTGCKDQNEDAHCQQLLSAFNISFGILFILLVFTVLQLCVSISTAAFGCKTLCRTAYSEVSVVIYQTTSPSPAQPNVGAALPYESNLATTFPDVKNL